MPCEGRLTFLFPPGRCVVVCAPVVHAGALVSRGSIGVGVGCEISIPLYIASTVMQVLPWVWVGLCVFASLTSVYLVVLAVGYECSWVCLCVIWSLC